MNEHYRATVRHFNTAASIDSAPDEAPMFGARCVSSPEDWVGDDSGARAAAATACIACPAGHAPKPPSTAKKSTTFGRVWTSPWS